jgi:serine/threonine protein kinase
MLRMSKYERFTWKTNIQIGIQLLDNLKSLHECGFIHGDLKPDNILIGSKDRTSIESSKLVLIDFGVSKRWRIGDEEHVKQEKTTVFTGN